MMPMEHPNSTILIVIQLLMLMGKLGTDLLEGTNAMQIADTIMHKEKERKRYHNLVIANLNFKICI